MHNPIQHRTQIKWMKTHGWEFWLKLLEITDITLVNDSIFGVLERDSGDIFHENSNIKIQKK